MPTTPETPAPQTGSLDEDFAKCHECAHGQAFYKRACALCDGTSQFIPYISEPKEAL